jgi:hypothetical protein
LQLKSYQNLQHMYLNGLDDLWAHQPHRDDIDQIRNYHSYLFFLLVSLVSTLAGQECHDMGRQAHP